MLVRLHGELGELFTEEIEIFCRKPKDSIDIINANFPGFRNHFLERANQYFEVILNDEITLTQLDLDFEFSELNTLDIYPVIEGSGDKLGGILGVGLVIGALAIPGFQAFGLSATHLGLMGGAMAFKGFFGVKNKTKDEKAEETPRSQLYNGTMNDTGSGMVPIVCGRITTGSIATSLDIKTSLVANN